NRLRADFPARFVEQEGAVWDPQRRALVARRESRFDPIVLDSRPARRVDPAHAAGALTDAGRELGIDSQAWTGGLHQWQARVASLRHWMPELELPDVSDEALMAGLDQWLLPAFAGKTRLDALSEQELGEALKSALDWNLRQQVDRLAPVRISVPSGMDRA